MSYHMFLLITHIFNCDMHPNECETIINVVVVFKIVKTPNKLKILLKDTETKELARGGGGWSSSDRSH